MIYNLKICWHKPILLLILFVFLITHNYGQTRIPNFEHHDRGELWDTMNDDGTHGSHPLRTGDYYPSMDWPAGPHTFNDPWDQRSYLYKAGVWIGGKYQNGEVFLTQNGPSEIDNGTFEDIIKYENYIGSQGYNPDEAEQKIVAEWTTTTNFNFQRTSRSWSFRNNNDYIIITYDVTNLNQETIDDVYVGIVFLLRPSYQDFRNCNGWGDALNRIDDRVEYDSTYKMIYSFDYTSAFDFINGIGNWTDGELLSPGFAGFAYLDATVHGNGEEQPAHIFFTDYLINAINLSLSGNSEEDLYAIVSGQDISLQTAQGDTIVPFTMMSFGPYDMNTGETISFSIVEAVDGLELDDVVDLENDEMFTIQDRFLNEGLDSLRSTVDNAIGLFNNNFVFTSLPPPSPEIDIIPSPAQQLISVTWDPLEDIWVNPKSNRINIEKYVVYRSDHAFIGPYDVIKSKIRVRKELDISRYFNNETGKWQYDDPSINLGVGYFYAVTTVDSMDNESWFTNMNEIPIKAASAPAEDVLDVSVFPNPFRKVSGIPTTGQENTIIWTNLPSPSTIKIYTSSGEWIRTIDHEGETGDATWDQLTNSKQRIAPGIYYWTVESEVGYAKGTLIVIK
ncbi:MAG: hypothetical protein ISS19_06940 [Bacteroidales bacterium]|nr:hypothetical protein [Bacteroidales bacterium]